ncbi:rho-related GTP-binding protein RhoU-like [Cloeon dipterum]|uniref:rho-related GTP-binding protein RhoU-like n=1 Tax=Cloeon dipterum TaxID=197152 RepID=UPI00321FFEA9
MPPFSDKALTATLLQYNADKGFEHCRQKVKCVMVGDGAVGKTSLVVSYTTNGFPTEYVPTAFDNYNVVVRIDGQPLRLQLCDTAGQDDFDSLRPLCYTGTDIFVVCFSVVSPASLHNAVTKWIPEVRSFCPDATILLTGTQSDLRADVGVLVRLARYGERPVSEMEARRVAAQCGACGYIECSALTQHNLKEVFDQAIVHGLRQQARSRAAADYRAPLPPKPRLKPTPFWKRLFCCTY